jgi:hypothetical protein
LKIEKEIEERCKGYFSKYETRLDALEQEVNKRADVPKVKELIEESLSGKARDGAEGQNHISEDIKEFSESEARRNNIIIFNVNESKSTEESILYTSLQFPSQFSNFHRFLFTWWTIPMQIGSL